MQLRQPLVVAADKQLTRWLSPVRVRELLGELEHGNETSEAFLVIAGRLHPPAPTAFAVEDAGKVLQMALDRQLIGKAVLVP